MTGLIACGVSGCDDTNVPEAETKSEANVSKAKIVRSPVGTLEIKAEEKSLKLSGDETVSVLIVIEQEELEVPDYARRDPTVSSEDRLERWRKIDSPQIKKSESKPVVLETTSLKNLATQIEKLTGRSVTVLPTAGTIVADVTSQQLSEIETWDDVSEVLPNRKIELP